MGTDKYRFTAGCLNLLEPINAPLREIGVRMTAPASGMRVLDVGCGGGALLDLYRHRGCEVTGVDLSPAMLTRARKRLGEDANLQTCDATQLPFADASFDLVTTMLVLHEMSDDSRASAVAEMRRVLAPDGHVLVIDFAPGRRHGLKGHLMRALSYLAEVAARHQRRSRAFLAAGGVPSLLASTFVTESSRVVAGGNMGLYVLAPRSASAS